MSDMKDIIETFSIMLKYIPEEGNDNFFSETCVSADHEQIWFGGPEKSELEEGDVMRLEELGIFWDEESWSKFL